PTNKNLIGFITLTPGTVIGSRGTPDVGGTALKENDTASIHGGRSGDQLRTIDGMRWNTLTSSASGTQFATVAAAAEEVNFTMGGGTAEYETGGITMNLVPKEGG